MSYFHDQFKATIDALLHGHAIAKRKKRPTATDYANKYQREAAYWREIADNLAEALAGVRCYANDVRTGHLIDQYEDGSDLKEMAAEDCKRMVAALAEYEAARINAEALR